jgi:hypothetical protein
VHHRCGIAEGGSPTEGSVRKLAVLCWHLIIKDENYAYGRPSLLAQKLRRLELRAGMPSRRGQRGSTHPYNLKEVRARERALSEQGEIAYRQLVDDWQAKANARVKRTGTGAATGVRLQPALTPSLDGKPDQMDYCPAPRGRTPPEPVARACAAAGR